jgi:O-antigen biosynthesis protein
MMKIEFLNPQHLVITSLNEQSAALVCKINGKNVGNTTILQEVDVESHINLFKTLNDFELSVWRAEDLIHKASFSLGINIGAEWSLENHNTAFLADGTAVSEDNAISKIAFATNHTELKPLTQYTFQGLFALHRCRGALKLEFYDAKKVLIYEITKDLDPKYVGGTRAEAYQALKFVFSTQSRAVFIRPVVIKYQTLLNEQDSYLFFTQLTLNSAKASDAHVSRELIDGFSGSAQQAYLHQTEFKLSQKTVALADAIKISLQTSKGKVVETAIYQQSDLEISQADVHVHANILYGRIVFERATFQKVHPLSIFVGKYRASIVNSSLDLEQNLIQFQAQPSEEVLDNNTHEIQVFLGLYRVYATFDYFTAQLTPFEALQQHAKQPLPNHLSPLAAFRYQNLEAVLRESGSRPEYDLQKVSVAHRILTEGIRVKRSRYESFTFPKAEQPKVSVVIPVHNQAHYTYSCLVALYFAYNKASFEVIVVDDGSTDDTKKILELFDGVVVVSHKTAGGFVRACNSGVAKARGEYIVLLNNDTEPLTNWIDEALAIFERFEQVGVVGSKLVYPDGVLQDAGGLVWSNAEPWNYGRGGNAQDPKFNYTRQCDYVSGAAMFVLREVWQKVGGLSQEFAPAYFEDTDFCFAVRTHGYKTMYAPKSVVCHYEGVSNGKDVKGQGLKRYQEVNQTTFRKKWSQACRYNGSKGVLPDLEKDRNIVGRVLFLDEQIPRPDMDAGGYAAIQEIRLIQSLGYKATFASEGLAYLGNYTDNLQRMGVEAVFAPFYNSIAELIAQRGREFDIIYVTRYTMAKKYIEKLRQHAPQAKIILNNADLHFLREMRAAMNTQIASDMSKALLTREAELEVMRQVDLVLTYTDVEQVVLVSHGIPDSKIAKCPWVLEPQENIKSFEERQHLAFLGSYSHPPNVEAVEFFCKEVMPLLAVEHPEIQFHIYGSNVPDWFEDLETDNIVVKGYVEDVAEVYNNHRVFVSPLLSGAGIKGKILTAMAYGLPFVATEVTLEGINLGLDSELFYVKNFKDPKNWISGLVVIYQNQKIWTELSIKLKNISHQNNSYNAAVVRFHAIFSRL